MDYELRRLGCNRVVEVFTRSARSAHFGSGYAISDDLVLTAGHVVTAAITADTRPDLVVRLPDGVELAAELAWSGEGIADAAVLRVPATPWRDEPDRGGLRWGKLVEDGVRCVARGYPRAQASDGVRDSETLRGTVNASVAQRSQRYDVDIHEPRLTPSGGGQSGWQGMSGAALFGPGRELLGVIVADPVLYGSSRLQAIPVTRLFGDDEFRRLTATTAGDLEDVGKRDVAELDGRGQAFLRAAYRAQPAELADFQLLQAEFATVPFIGRETERRQLQEWCVASQRFSAGVITGDGGAGKTRLAAELCRDLGAAGWSAGFAEEATLDRAIQAGKYVDLVWPTLLVIDYPDRLTDATIEMIGRLGERNHGPRLRILLLDRAVEGVSAEAPLPERATWWRRLNRNTGGLVKERMRVAIRLEAGGLELEDRQRHIKDAWPRFGGRPAAVPALDLTDDEYRNPLKVHLAVLLAARGESHPAAGEVIRRFLEREEARWHGRLPAHHLADLTDSLAHQCVALVTLTTPTPAETVELLDALPRLSGPGLLERRSKVAEWLTELFPGGARLAPMAPDLLAEQLLATTPELTEILLLIHRHESCDAHHTVRMLDALRLATTRDNVREALRTLLIQRLDALLQSADRAPLLVDPIATAIVRSKEFDTDHQLAAAAARIESRPPMRASAMAQLYGQVTELAVEWYGAQQPESEARGAYADALTDLVAYRSAGGDLAEAAHAAELALQEYRVLGAATSSMARAAYNSGTCLGLVGEANQALDRLGEAAQLYQQLAGDEFRQQRIDAQTNLAVCRADVGDQAGGLEACIKAIEDYQGIDGRNYFLVMLAEPLRFLADSLATDPAGVRELRATPDGYRPAAGIDDGWWQAEDHEKLTLPLSRLIARLTPGLAERTPAVRRDALLPWMFGRFARQQGQRAAENYSEFLRALALDLGQEGLYAEALGPLRESTLLLRRFKGWPERLANGLSLLGHFSYLAGRIDDAIGHGAEAVTEYRAMVANHPNTFEADLAGALDTLAGRLSEVHRVQEAGSAWREAADLYRDLVEHDPRHRSDLAEIQVGLGLALIEIDRTTEAVDILKDANTLLADLAAGDPQYAGQHLTALMLLSSLVAAPGGSALSVEAAQQAVELTRSIAAADAGKRLQHVNALIALSTALGISGQVTEAYRHAEQAVELGRRALAADDSVEATATLSQALSQAGLWTQRQGRQEEALVLTEEAAEVLVGVPDDDSLVLVARAAALSILSAVLVGRRRADEALPLAHKAVEHFEKLVRAGETYPGRDLGHAEALLTLAQCRLLLGEQSEGRAHAVAARTVLVQSPRDSPLVRLLLARSHLVEGGCLAGLEQPAEAVQELAKADDLLRTADAEDRLAQLVRASALGFIAGCQIDLGAMDQAAEYADRSLTLLRGVDDIPEQRGELARTLSFLAIGLTELGQAEQGLQRAEEALEIYDLQPPVTAAERLLLGLVQTSAGVCLATVGRPADALPLLERALDTYGGLPAGQDPATMAVALTHYASCHLGLGNLAEASEATEQALRLLGESELLHTRVPVRLQYANLLWIRAQCLMQLDQPAGDVLDQAVAVLDDIDSDDPGVRMFLMQVVGTQAFYRTEEGLSGAVESAARSVQLYREFDSVPEVRPALASALGLLGVGLLDAERSQEALDPLREASERFAELADSSPESVFERIAVEQRFAQCLSTTGDADGAVQHASTALEIATAVVGDDQDLLPVLNDAKLLVAELLMDVGRSADALLLLQEVSTNQLPLAQQSPAEASLLVQALALQAQALTHLGRGDEALDVLELANHWTTATPDAAPDSPAATDS